MLVLSRKKFEEVVLVKDGEVIATVAVVEIRGAFKARLGFEAGQDVQIHRREVWDAICRDQGKPTLGEIMPGRYVVTKDWHVIVGVTALAIEPGRIVEVGQIDKQTKKAIVRFGERLVDWIAFGNIRKHCQPAESVVEGGSR